MRIQHNIMAMNAYRNYNNNTSALSKNLEKLSSGYKINRAGDDAAGLAISEKMRAQITGLNAAQKNVKDGISLVKTAEGAMQEIQDMLNRMDYLATQSANGTYDDPVDRANLQKEVTALKDEINRIADSANFNGIKLLDGSQSASNASALTATATTFAGVDSAPELKDMTASVAGNFAAKTDSSPNVHECDGYIPQATVSFTIDLTGLSAKISAAGASNTFAVNVMGKDLTVTASNTATQMGAQDIADALGGNDFNIQGVTFTATAGTGTNAGKVTFTLKAGQTYTSAVAANLNGKEGSVPTAGSASANVTLNGQPVHGIEDYVKAQEEKPATPAGINFTLDSNIVSQGNVLSINGKEFVFQTTSTTITATTGQTVINVSNVTGTDAQVAEALRQLTDTTKSEGASDGIQGDDFKFKLVASGSPNVLHLEQMAETDGSYKKCTYEDMVGLVEFQKNVSTASAEGGVDLALDSSKFQKGDRITIGDTTYTVAEATDADKNEVTAADLMTKIKDAVQTEVGSKYTADVTETGIRVKANAHGDDDNTAALATLKEKVESVLSGIAGATSKGQGLTLQIGDTSDSFNQLNVSIGDMHVYAMGVMNDAVDGEKITVDGDQSIANIDISTQEGAQKAIDVIKGAINYVSSVRGDLGAIQNRLEHTQNNLSVMAENIQDAESTIRDTDVAEEMMSYVKNNILVQSAQAMLAQANQVPQGVLQLLG